jgi:hypothetical protein
MAAFLKMAYRFSLHYSGYIVYRPKEDCIDPIFKKITEGALQTQKMSAYFLETCNTGQNVFIIILYSSASIVFRAAIDFVSKVA